MEANVMKKFLWMLILSGCLLAPACSAYRQTGGEASVVRYVLDGDTIILENGEKVRLIGVDTPEIHDDEHRNAAHARKYGQDPRIVDEYALKAKSFVLGEMLRQPVRLEYDWQLMDKYSRTLAYVYRASDDFFLNEELVKQGYGYAYTRFPFKYQNQFRGDQDDARRGHRGLWQ